MKRVLPLLLLAISLIVVPFITFAQTETTEEGSLDSGTIDSQFEYIYSVSGIERDDRFKELALKNIKNNPIKFLRNCLANQGRMWFRYPFSFRF